MKFCSGAGGEEQGISVLFGSVDPVGRFRSVSVDPDLSRLCSVEISGDNENNRPHCPARPFLFRLMFLAIINNIDTSRHELYDRRHIHMPCSGRGCPHRPSPIRPPDY